MHKEPTNGNSQPQHRGPASQAQRREELESALRALRGDWRYLGETERAVADYCRDRHRDGAEAVEVVLEIKRIGYMVLGVDDPHLERLISSCIKHFYGDVEV